MSSRKYGPPPKVDDAAEEPLLPGRPPVQWLTTAPNPRYLDRTHGADQGQRGWRLHAIEAGAGALLAEVRYKSAFCGLLPGTGWGLDLFIDQKCARCERVLARLRGLDEAGRAEALSRLAAGI